jgi:hypothetical protein
MAALNVAPVAVILPEGTPAKLTTPAGRSVIQCPAQRVEGLTCKQCRLCAKAARKVIVGLEAHGTAQKYVSQRLIQANSLLRRLPPAASA